MKNENITLYFTSGSSDKIYTASLEEVDNDQFLVNFAYGRRGSTLTTGTKTKTPVDYDKAKKAYDKLVKSKTSKGYKPGEEGPQYVHTDSDMRETGVQCQLLNFIEEAQVAQLIQDKEWWAQEKHDGKRMLLQKTDSVTAINRSGLSVGAPDKVIERAGQVEQSYLIDGEAIGETLFVFDLLESQNKGFRAEPYAQRLTELESLGLDGALVVVETAKTSQEKQDLFERLEASGGEGIVFKKQGATYSAGRPASGGDQLKFKFYATASVRVSKINDKRSVAMELLDEGQPVAVGNVTIPPNKDIPSEGAIIEVRYLYAYKGGSLYQPTYIGLRDDIPAEDCIMAQLKYKQNTE